LYADKLNDAFVTMKKNNMFKQVTFYLEACESGSMFPDLTTDGGIYGMTASNASLSSWASYCGSEAYVDGKNIGSCLGDLFSTNWMEDTDKAISDKAMGTETLDTQYHTVLTETTKSPVEIFGDLSFKSYPIGDFEGILTPNSQEGFLQSFQREMHGLFEDEPTPKSTQHVNQRDSRLHYLYGKVTSDGGEYAHGALIEELEGRDRYNTFFREVYPEIDTMEINGDLKNYDCYRHLIDTFEQGCGKFSEYGMKFMRYFAHTCAVDDKDEVVRITHKIGMICDAIM
jgi:legumain